MESLSGTKSPNKAASWAILSNTLRTISPRYIPEIVFSNICLTRTLNITCQVCGRLENSKYKNNSYKTNVEDESIRQGVHIYSQKDTVHWFTNLSVTCSPGFMLAASISLSNSLKGRPFENAPHSVLIICTANINKIKRCSHSEHFIFFTLISLCETSVETRIKSYSSHQSTQCWA